MNDDRRERLALDALVSQLGEPGIGARLRRRLSFRKTSGHVNPLMLAGSEPDSFYVREWRRHAHECPSCAELFAYFGLELEAPDRS